MTFASSPDDPVDDELTAALRELAEGEHPLLEEDLVPEVRRALARRPARRLAPVVLLAGAGAATLLLIAPVDEGVREKAATETIVGPQLRAFVVDGRGSRPLSASMRADEALAFSVTVGDAKVEHFVMIFAVDAGGEIRWYHPAFTDPATDPTSYALRAVDEEELPDAVRHPLPRGELTIHAVWTKTPLRVSEVERAMRVGQDDGNDPALPVAASWRKLRTVVQ